MQNVDLNQFEVCYFDGVMVCNGHYNDPNIPTYPGQNVFKGKQIHSHDFRRTDQFKGFYKNLFFLSFNIDLLFG